MGIIFECDIFATHDATVPAVSQVAAESGLDAARDQLSTFIYGSLPSGQDTGSVRQFDPYDDEWGNQLEED